MMKTKEIERLEGQGITARVTNKGKLFTTYEEFASNSGYRDSVDWGFPYVKADKLREREGEVFEVLAKGDHDSSRYGKVYVIESKDEERFLIEESGLELIYPPKEIHEMSYGELTEHARIVLDELRTKAYAEGYEQGKFDAEMDDGNYGNPPTVDEMMELGRQVTETAQDERDRIVERAKEDVEKLKNTRGHYEAGVKICNAEFIVNKNKRTIVCLLRGYETNDVLFKGIAKCAPSDCFNTALGKAIALRRALGLAVPDEYLNAPQPTEVRVGDKIRMKSYNPDGIREDHFYEEIIKSFDGNKVRYDQGGFDFRESVDKDAKIIDDSRDGGE